jgi:hypothetical protein
MKVRRATSSVHERGFPKKYRLLICTNTETVIPKRRRAANIFNDFSAALVSEAMSPIPHDW